MRRFSTFHASVFFPQRAAFANDSSNEDQRPRFSPTGRTQEQDLLFLASKPLNVSKVGFLDRIDGDMLHGWAFDTEAQASPRIVVSVGDTIIDEFVGTTFRPDLVSAGVGNGHHGFAWRVPADLDLDSHALLSLRFADTGELLQGSERISAVRALVESDPFAGTLSSGLWVAERFEWSENSVRIAGWAVPPFGSPIDFAITHNGVPLDVLETCERPDIAERFARIGENRRFGFVVESTNVAGDAMGAHEFAFVNAHTKKPFNHNHTVHVLPIATPSPGEAQRKRVHGSEDLFAYERIGATIFTRLGRVVQEYFGSELGDASAILDWGCGAGRVFQFFSPQDRSRLTGIDIDDENIAWCRQAFPEARFEVVSLETPTAFPAESFDLVFGISVLTHMAEARQLEWLAELRRITRPGAILLVSVNGESMWLTGGLSLDRYGEWRSRGSLVVGKNHDLDGSRADGSEYYDVFTSRRYIFENWSRYFNVVDVLAGAVSQQDLVILQRV